MIKDYKLFRVFEELTEPWDEEPPLQYNQYFTNNWVGFKQELLDDLKLKLIGKTICIDATRQYDWRVKQEPDPIDNIVINGTHVKPIYKITVKDIQYDGSHRQEVYYVDIIDDEGKRYKLKKIVTDKTYANFAKKAGKELERMAEEKRKKERLKLKHLYHDPYAEELWDEDD